MINQKYQPDFKPEEWSERDRHYLMPFVPIMDGEDKELAAELEELVKFHHAHDMKSFASKAKQFYAKWLAAYGDDSIAQMAGTYLVVWGISQVSMKFIEDFRISLAPIEKSTRYVDFSKKVDRKY